MFSQATNLPSGGPQAAPGHSESNIPHSRASFESPFSTPTGSNRSSVYSELLDFLANPNVRLPPTPAVTQAGESGASSRQPTPATQSQYSQQQPAEIPLYRRISNVGLRRPLLQPRSKLHTTYPVWNSLQKFINWATLLRILSFENFSDTFEFSNSTEKKKHAVHCVKLAAFEAFTTIHHAHSNDATKKRLEIVSDEGKSY
jgi:hypothetical protein